MFPYGLAISFLGMYSREMKTESQETIKIFAIAFFITAQVCDKLNVFSV